MDVRDRAASAPIADVDLVDAAGGEVVGAPKAADDGEGKGRGSGVVRAPEMVEKAAGGGVIQVAAREIDSGGREAESAVDDGRSGEIGDSGLVRAVEMMRGGGEKAIDMDDGVISENQVKGCEVVAAQEMDCGGREADKRRWKGKGEGAPEMIPADVDDGEGCVISESQVKGCEVVVAEEMDSGGREAESALDDESRSCKGEGESEVVRALEMLSCGAEKAADMDDGEGEGGVSENQVKSSEVIAAPSGREAESAVDEDGSGKSRSSTLVDRVDGEAAAEDCERNGAATEVQTDQSDSSGQVAAPAMISGEEAAAVVDDKDNGRNSKKCKGDAAKEVLTVKVEGCGQVEAPVVISVKQEVSAAVDDVGSGGKKKRGRPQRGQVRAVVAKKVKVEEEEEDVCFICFDGGSLVLCDKRGCPKAYHPACIKRDEAFFQSKAKWNCGWHICSICQKAAHHMCYTCTYSLCKSCTKDADYLSVRDNKGLCATCMRMVKMIEQDIPGSTDTVQVDFDDKSSWEYLFKIYWVYLKEKISLSLDELIQAKSPYKAVEIVGPKEQPIVPKEQRIVPKEEPLDLVCGSGDCKSSVSNARSRTLEATDSKKRRIKEQRILPKIKGCQSRAKSNSGKRTALSGSTEWATKELLEFVAHMRNGDISMLSQFDIQSLLLEYIKRNNLRDPHRKSQIICDSRLMNLFFKPRVGHFEMLKLLEYHFLIKEDSQKENALGNTVPDQVEGGGHNESLLIDKDKKRKTRKRCEDKGPQMNLDEFAAIDIHNINLIYLRRSLMENLVTANAKFRDKVVGSIVRIRISGADPKQDMYRLVQVIDTCKASVPYKVGGKTVDVMLVILNLHKKETVAIDSISNQEFSEDECRRLRRSIKYGVVKQMTVGLVQEKARELQEVRLNDWLETEMMRLNHLRDRASEKGRRKELRECVEKIELLKTPEERQRRLNEKLQVHADPKMDPKCESDDDAGEISKQKQVDQVKQKFPGFRKLGRDPISTPNKCKQAKFNSEKGPSTKFREKVHESPKRKGAVASKAPLVSLLPKREDAAVAEIPTVSLSNSNIPSAYKSETEKFWQYRDPNGKIQGPFCLVQLRKWSTTGYFPPDMRVWNINTDESDSFLLTDVLNGYFLKVLPSRSNTSLPDRLHICEDRHSSTVNPTLVNDGKQSNGSWNCTSATSMNQMTVHEDRRWNTGTSNGNLSSLGNKLYPQALHENQSDNQRFSVQSSAGSWRPLSVKIASNNSDSNFSLATVVKSADSGPLQINAQNLRKHGPVATDSGMLNNHTSKDQKPSQICPPVQDLIMEELPSPTPKLRDRDEKADLGNQNLPFPAPMAVDMDEKVDSSFVNSPNSLPNAGAKDEIIQASESKPPDTNCSPGSNTPMQSGTSEEADVHVQNLQSPSAKVVDQINMVNLIIQNSSTSPNPGNIDDKFGAHESKSPLTSFTCDSVTSEPSERDEKDGLSIQNLPSFSSKTVDGDGKVDSGIQNMPTSPQDRSNRNNDVRVSESEPPGSRLIFTSSTAKADVRGEKGTGPCPKTSDEDKKVGLTFQNLPSFPPDTRDGNGKTQPESKPPITGLTYNSSPLKLSNRDEKAGKDTQNLSSPSPTMVNEDDKVDSTANNLSSSTMDSTYDNEKAVTNENKSPGTCLTCSSSPPEPSDRYQKSGSVTQNVPCLSPKTVHGESDLPVKDYPSSPSDTKDGNVKVLVNECKSPGSSLTCNSNISEPKKTDGEDNVHIKNLPSPSPNLISGDEKVDSTPNMIHTNEKVEDCCSSPQRPEKSNDQFSTAASVTNQFVSPPASDHPSSISNWNFELIELSALAEESVSDLWAEVDAMEAQGEAAPPTSGDDFFEDSKCDYFASISGMDHLFDFGKSDNVSSNGESSSLPQPAIIVSEPLGLTQFNIFDSTKRSNGEASTSSGLGLDAQHSHNSSNYVENGTNNNISLETRSMSSNWGNTNLGFGGLVQGMTNINWGSHPSLAQVNMDMNQNISFGFMGHERHGNRRNDGSGS